MSASHGEYRNPAGKAHVRRALEHATDDGYERVASFIVPRGSRLEKFFTALERAEAEAVETGWWPAEEVA